MIGFPLLHDLRLVTYYKKPSNLHAAATALTPHVCVRSATATSVGAHVLTRSVSTAALPRSPR